MRLSDAGLRRHQPKALYVNHRPLPWLTEDASRDRSNRLLGNKLRSRLLTHQTLELPGTLDTNEFSKQRECKIARDHCDNRTGSVVQH
jgi:hypothetical protein